MMFLCFHLEDISLDQKVKESVIKDFNLGIICISKAKILMILHYILWEFFYKPID